MSNLVELHRSKVARDIRDRTRILTRALPFFRPNNRSFIHRVRSGTQYLRPDGSVSHTAFGYWCTATGFISKDRPQAQLLAKPLEGVPLCQECEVRYRRAMKL